ncbi:serine/threonine-protein kinase [Paludisphaera mucosa]|uniref:Tetratricopeptide repeat protein n=1 Tax=Paludisphaera mucosa TaxID=3030827 RepID=A0ABT6FI22_9BACT|nr:serine/threonine-protein kinase [Paludisphaera mucosa]MDG3007136.1 tetratricopeptide repeat protein [Paludisphaera mucosa]
MAIDPALIDSLFRAAVEREELDDRLALLDRRIAADPELRAELMDAQLDDGDTLNRADESGPTTDADSDAPWAGGPPASTEAYVSGQPPCGESVAAAAMVDVVIAGRYQIRRAIGEGGMGSVFLADQLTPVRREVALKLVKSGMDSRAVLTRFEAERQALALMDHPNIAKVLDAGATEQGRPFFVMELVRGVPLTEYCHAHRLDLLSRLALLREICSAVQHAHQKGVIHRDLKPSNILVESHDGRAVPKVIDFGLAKAFGGLELTEHSLFSAFGGVAGTPQYMAPEQATFNAVDVDTRADVYALGVILYELLTGGTPIPRATLKQTPLDEILRMIREDEPPAPSSRIRASGASPSLVANRRVEPARLRRLVRGDLDWIVIKALAKDRRRRYDSAAGLADDVERFLKHEPVVAGPPTAAYRLRKFVRRHRGRVVAGTLVLAALAAGLVATSLALHEARLQRGLAETRGKEVAKRLAQKDKANEILLAIFQDLDPDGGDGKSPSLAARLAQRLDVATAALEGEATDDPLGVAGLQMALGGTQRNLGYFEKAIDLFEKAHATYLARLGAGHYDTLNSVASLAVCHDRAGRPGRAIELYEEVLASSKLALGPNHPCTLWASASLAICYDRAGRADRITRLEEDTRSVAGAVLDPNLPETLSSMASLAIRHFHAGRLDQAIRLAEETWARMKSKLGPDHPDTLRVMGNLALSYGKVGQWQRAVDLRLEILTLTKAKFGPDHLSTMKSMRELAIYHSQAGDRHRAIQLHEETCALMRSRLGPDHPETMESMQSLANSYSAAKQWSRAITILEETLALRKSNLGPDHPESLNTMRTLALSYDYAGQSDQALRHYELTLDLRREKLGPHHLATLESLADLATARKLVGQFDRLEPIWDALIEGRREAFGQDHPETVAARLRRAKLDLSRGRLKKAEFAYGEILNDCRTKLGPDHAVTDDAESALASLHEKQGDFAEALPLRRSLVIRARSNHSLRVGLTGRLTRLGSCLNNLKAWPEAESIAREALSHCEQASPQAWTAYRARSMLGAALLGQRRWAEAEPLLRDGYQGMKASEISIPHEEKVYLDWALRRLIALAKATGDVEELAAWEAERKVLTSPKPKPPEALPESL